MNMKRRNRSYMRRLPSLVAVAIGTIQLILVYSDNLHVKALISPSRVFRRTKSPHEHIITTLYSTITPNQSNGARKYRPRKGQPAHNKRQTSNVPWGADFITSRRTQDKIQSAAANASEHSDPFQCAESILQTLLNTPATECNAANIVCALTLSAKTLGGRKYGRVRVSDDYHQCLAETIAVLQMLIDSNKLSPRQLCNSAWAIAKHVEHDKSLLIDEVFDSIAFRMIEHLKMIRGANVDNKRHVQTGELSMLLWAYASAKPRDLPPGWERPPQFEQISRKREQSLKKKSKNKNREDHLVTFITTDDETTSDSETEDANDGDKQRRSATTTLFDTAAISFCRGEGAAAIQSNSNDNTSLLKNCTWSELSNVAWSFATRGAYDTKQSDAMMSFLAREATRRIKYAITAPAVLTGGKRNKYCRVLPRDVVQIAWALGTMESDNVSNGNALVHLVDVINEYWMNNGGSTESYRQLRSWKSADLVQLAAALSHGRLDNLSVLEAIYGECLRRLRASMQNNQTSLSAPELSILLWAQARLNLTGESASVFTEFPSLACRAMLNLLTKKADTALDKIGLRSQEQANLAWSLTVLNQFDEHITSLLQHVFRASSSLPDGTIQLEHAHQLWQAFFILSDDCPEAVKAVPPEFSQYLESKWKAEKSRTKKSSHRHKAISKTLQLLGIAHENEYKEDVDVAIALRDTSSFTHKSQLPISELNEENVQHKIAVEFDGPYHFTLMASTGEELAQIENGTKIQPRVLGHTVFKYKILKKKGWTVIRIPYYEWDKIPHWASMERQRYLQRCLKTHQEIQFSDVDVSEYQALPQTRHSRFD